jgi:hypothetical protein
VSESREKWREKNEKNSLRHSSGSPMTEATTERRSHLPWRGWGAVVSRLTYNNRFLGVTTVKKSPWPSIKQQVHHNDTDCNTGNNIERENVRQGTGGKPLCAECARLPR